MATLNLLGFWEAFLPNFVATILGVVLGLPAAIYVNRKLSAYQHRHEAEASARKFSDIAGVIIRSLNYNKQLLGSMSELCKTAQVMRNPDLQLTTWDAVGDSFASVCTEPGLIQVLSHHWLRLSRLSEINREMFDRVTGSLPEIEDEELRSNMWGELYQSSTDLYHHVDDIIIMLQEAVAKK